MVKPSRAVPQATRLFLYVRAGGRCEFDGCNDYLLEHHVTKADGNFAEMAHIWAFSKVGPRSRRGGTGADVHDIGNLMLLCARCHKLVDDNPSRFTVDVLRGFKRAHEERVFMLTDTKPDRDTVAVVLRGRVAGKPVTISLEEIQSAVTPRYLGQRGVCDIDLTAIADSVASEFWKTASEAVRQKMSRFYESPFDSGPPRHVSVFALAPIPLLMTLGSCLSDKVPATLYQRHRDTEDWKWKAKGPVVEFETARARKGSDATLVALLVSVSGKVAEEELPAEIDGHFTLYSISPRGRRPELSLLGREDSFHAFRHEYQRAMRVIVEQHPSAKTVAVFPAVPAPVAVAMGRGLLPKRDPSLLVYDFSKADGGFVKTLEINP